MSMMAAAGRGDETLDGALARLRGHRPLREFPQGYQYEQPAPSREAAEEDLRRLAHGLVGSEDERVHRLLERVASSGPELRDVLVELGARVVVREVARGGRAAAAAPCVHGGAGPTSGSAPLTEGV